MNKKIFLIMSIAIIFVLIIAETTVNTTASANSTATVKEKVITTTGKASVPTVPDIAYVNIGIIAENQSLDKAQNEVKEKTANILKELKNLKIQEKDIQTTYFNVNPKYIWNEKTNTNSIENYTVSNSLEVKISEIDKTGNILNKVVDVGSNMINGLRFGVSNEKDLYNEALSLAVKDAESKALAMGKSYNIKNLKPLNITENSIDSAPYYKKIGRAHV